MRLRARFSGATLPLLALCVASVATTLHADVVNIDNDTLRDLVASGVPLVDVRRPEEWEDTGVIERSELLTFFDEEGAYDAGAWLAKIEQIATPDEPVILICRSGNRTNLISRWLSEEQGYDTVYNVAEGMLSWQADGGRTVTP